MDGNGLATFFNSARGFPLLLANYMTRHNQEKAHRDHDLPTNRLIDMYREESMSSICQPSYTNRSSPRFVLIVEVSYSWEVFVIGYLFFWRSGLEIEGACLP